MKKLIEDNFQAHANHIPQLTDGMQVFHLENLSYVDSGLSCDTFNIIHIHHQQVKKAEIKEALNYYQDKKLEYCIWILEENLSNEIKKYFEFENLNLQNQEVAMVLDLNNFIPSISKNDPPIKEVKQEEELRDFARVIAKNWTPPDQNVISYYQSTAPQYVNPESPSQLFVYYEQGKPVSTLELFASSHRTAGIYGLATLASHRGKGIASSLLDHGLRQAKRQGIQKVVLQATKEGQGIYKKRGFRAMGTYFEYA